MPTRKVQEVNYNESSEEEEEELPPRNIKAELNKEDQSSTELNKEDHSSRDADDESVGVQQANKRPRWEDNRDAEDDSAGVQQAKKRPRWDDNEALTEDTIVYAMRMQRAIDAHREWAMASRRAGKNASRATGDIHRLEIARANKLSLSERKEIQYEVDGRFNLISTIDVMVVMVATIPAKKPTV